MQSLFQQSYNTALIQMDPSNKKQKPDVPAQSDKLDQLEKELRMDNKQQKTQQANMTAGTAQAPTTDQRQKLQQMAPTDANYKYFANKLGDYSSLLSQMRTDSERLAQPMLASTLENQKESHKLAAANEQFSLLSNQFGLNARADKVFKKAKKYPKLSNQSSWL
jgi:hypothetical protein